MKKLFLLLSLTTLFCAATCNQGTTISEDCIDESKIDPEMVCIEIYQPVCGCDGRTYSNECYAKRAGLTSWTDGECEDDN